MPNVPKMLKFTNESIEDMLNIGVYTITSKKSGKTYVGCTSKLTGYHNRNRGFYYRWQKHVCLLINNKHHNILLQRHVNKYGIDDLKFEILDTYEPEHCESMELYWINMLDSVKNGFNIMYGKTPTSGKSHYSYKNVDYISIINDYNSGLSLDKLALKYNVCDKKIKQTLVEHNIIPVNKNIYSPEIFEEIYKEYIDKDGKLDNVAKKYNIDVCTILKYFKINNYPLKNSIRSLENKEILNKFNNGATRRELEKEYNRSRYSIGNVLRLTSL